MEPTQNPVPEEQLDATAHVPTLLPAVAPASASALTTPIAVIIAGVLIAIAVLFSGLIGHGKSGGTAAAAQPAPALADTIANVKLDGAPFIGDPSAPALAYFSDFQCPYCKRLDQTILPTLKAKYVDTDKLRIVFKDFVFLGPDSQTAALFGQAVWHLYPQQYFAWREAMYNAQDEENSGFGDQASIEKLTATIPGIDQAKVSADVAANGTAYAKTISDEASETENLGITGTPTIIVGSQVVGGFDTLAHYEAAIDTALAGK